MTILDVLDLKTKIGTDTLINDITFQLNRGSVTALVGHNGAGKSTLIKTIMGIIDKTEGEIVIKDKVSQDDHFLEFKQLIAYLPEEPLLLTELTVMQHFQLYGMSYGLTEDVLTERVNRYVKGFDLTSKLNDYPESLSKGMRQKVQTICAFLPDTPILLIDEPFMGLDIYAMDYLERLVIEKTDQGVAILLTTHQLERVKDIADQFIMLQHGSITSKGPISEFETIKRSSD